MVMSDPGMGQGVQVYPLLVNNEYIFGLANGCELKAGDIKRIVGGALAQVQGVLGLKGGLADVFKRDEDLTRGISVAVDDDRKVRVGARLIADVTVDPGVIFADAAGRVSDALQQQAGLCPERLDLEIAELMLESEFCDKYNEGRALQDLCPAQGQQGL